MIAEELLGETGKHARAEGTTLRTMIEEGLRTVPPQSEVSESGFKLPDGSFRGDGLRPDAQESSWEEIRSLSYGDLIPTSSVTAGHAANLPRTWDPGRFR
ncbi:hypothetical protein [Glycomyces xiaoerkulensis]|uniref:hypothetical protein n=1 Tax=Glycomyces xiaoerkulensis TaxID=2038139 RepID=UPI0018E482EE|nr:hypothetical protein [Glycomyces xiaoerkulensis]